MSGRVGLVVVALAGYLLGRMKKLKLALRAAGAIAGLNKGQDIVARTTRVLDSPGAKLVVNRVGGTLVEAAEGALTTAVSKGVRSLSENLQARAEKLRAPDDEEASGEDREREQEPRDEDRGSGRESSRDSAGRSPGESSERSSGVGRSATRPARTSE